MSQVMKNRVAKITAVIGVIYYFQMLALFMCFHLLQAITIIFSIGFLNKLVEHLS